MTRRASSVYTFQWWLLRTLLTLLQNSLTALCQLCQPQTAPTQLWTVKKHPVTSCLSILLKIVIAMHCIWADSTSEYWVLVEHWDCNLSYFMEECLPVNHLVKTVPMDKSSTGHCSLQLSRRGAAGIWWYLLVRIAVPWKTTENWFAKEASSQPSQLLQGCFCSKPTFLSLKVKESYFQYYLFYLP